AAPEVAAPVAIAAVEPAPTPIAEVEGARPAIVFAAPQEVVQPLPTRASRRALAAKAPGKPAVAPVAARVEPEQVAAKAPASGNFYLQLGAYPSAAVARDGWLRATRRFAGFGGHTPSGMAFKSAAGSFYRLSLGGFARADAVALCNAYRAKGGNCFVRQGAGDQVAAWVKSGRELAAR
ncbi:MAG: SPOR domain-containing protein, partial [Sphingomonas sp.]|nr:SPOR domain-containing protein [Sphingomonas sp.]